MKSFIYRQFYKINNIAHNNWNYEHNYPVFLDEVDKGSPFDLDWLVVLVEEGKDKVEKVAFPQIGRRLFLVVCPGYPEAGRWSLF